MEEAIPFNKFLGLRCIGIGDGFVRMELPFRPEFVGDPVKQALHGGVIATVADVAGGTALWATLPTPQARVSTIDLRIDYLRPGRAQTLVAEAKVVRAGQRVGVVDVTLFHPNDEAYVIATGKGVYNIKLSKEHGFEAAR